MNKTQIRNPTPHSIPATSSCSTAAGRGLALESGTTKLSPRVRQREPAAGDPVDPGACDRALAGSALVIEDGGLDQAPRIVATPRAVQPRLGQPRLRFRHHRGPRQLWQILPPRGAAHRPGEPRRFLRTRRSTSAMPGREGRRAGTIHIIQAVQEIGVGDRLLPAGKPELLSYVPHARRATSKRAWFRSTAIAGTKVCWSRTARRWPQTGAVPISMVTTSAASRPLEVVAINRAGATGSSPVTSWPCTAGDDYKLDRSRRAVLPRPQSAPKTCACR